MSNTENFRNVEMRLRVMSVDYDSRTMVVKFAFGNSKYQEHVVQASGLLLAKYKNQRADYRLNHTYKGTICSDDWRTNPIQIIRYELPNGEPALLASCVHQKSTKTVKRVLPGGLETTEYIYKFKSKKYFCRWNDIIEDKARISERKEAQTV